MYADDCQVYLSSPASDTASAVDRLSACVADVNNWMMASRLRLNPSKTQVTWLGSSQQLDKINITDVPQSAVINTALDLGVILDSQLSLDVHVASVCRRSYYQLKQLCPVARSLSVEAAKTLVQTFVSSRLDYCNAILHGLPRS